MVEFTIPLFISTALFPFLSWSNPVVSIPEGALVVRNVNYTASATKIKTKLLIY